MSLFFVKGTMMLNKWNFYFFCSFMRMYAKVKPINAFDNIMPFSQKQTQKALLESNVCLVYVLKCVCKMSIILMVSRSKIGWTCGLKTSPYSIPDKIVFISEDLMSSCFGVCFFVGVVNVTTWCYNN